MKDMLLSHKKKILTVAIALSALVVLFVVIGVKQEVPVDKNTPQQEQVAVQDAPKEKAPSEYIEVMDSCGPYFGGACVNVRSGPGVEYAKVAKLRTSQVLRVTDSVEKDGVTWYKIEFDEWLRYPDRVSEDWYVSGEYVRYFTDPGVIEYDPEHPTKTVKRIVIDRSEQMLYAYDGKELFIKEPTSTGLDDTPTPRGYFTLFRKTPTRYMQGPIPEISDQYYDLPGVPWNLYFTLQGGAIHGTYWHDKFGTQHSHGCVNLAPETAKRLYEWADIGMSVLVQD